MKRLLILLPFAVLSCAAVPCISEHGLQADTRCDELAALDSAAVPLLIEDGLSPDSLEGVMLVVHAGGDGGNWEPDAKQRDAGWTSIGGETLCYAREVTLANDQWDSAAACHELFHIARGCQGNDIDHPWMAARHVDERCAIATGRTLSNLTGSTGSSE